MSYSNAGSSATPNTFQRVRQGWAVVEDSVVARQLQGDEVQLHFDANRRTRQTVRDDIRTARREQEVEQLRAAAERLRRAERRREEEEEEEEAAAAAAAAAAASSSAAAAAGEDTDDGETPAASLEELERERRDELLARDLQEREERRYERWKARQREKELRRERRRLEQAIAADLAAPAPAHDDADFSDLCRLPADAPEEERRRLQAEQDADLARLLQEQESKRGGPGRSRIEDQDRRLAEVIQRQEELRAQRRRPRSGRSRPHRVNDAGTQTPVEESERPPSPEYALLATARSASPQRPLTVAIPEPGAEAPLRFDTGSPLVDDKYVGSPVTRLDAKIRAGSRLVGRRPGVRESLVEAVTGSAELAAELASRSAAREREPPACPPPSRPPPPPPAAVREEEEEREPVVYAISPIQRVIPVDPPASHRAQVRQPGPFAYENSTLFRPAVPFSSPEAATTPLGPTLNIATAIDPTYRQQRPGSAGLAARPQRPKSMHELRPHVAAAADTAWEEGVPMPIHGERRRPSDPRLASSGDKKPSGNCRVQ